MPKVLSLNVTDGGRRVQPLVADALASLAPDLVTLQEVRADTNERRLRSQARNCPQGTGHPPRSLPGLFWGIVKPCGARQKTSVAMNGPGSVLFWAPPRLGLCSDRAWMTR